MEYFNLSIKINITKSWSYKVPTQQRSKKQGRNIQLLSLRPPLVLQFNTLSNTFNSPLGCRITHPFPSLSQMKENPYYKSLLNRAPYHSEHISDGEPKLLNFVIQSHRWSVSLKPISPLPVTGALAPFVRGSYTTGWACCIARCRLAPGWRGLQFVSVVSKMNQKGF